VTPFERRAATRELRRRNGLCTKCGAKSPRGRALCTSCATKVHAGWERWRKRHGLPPQPKRDEVPTFEQFVREIDG